MRPVASLCTPFRRHRYPAAQIGRVDRSTDIFIALLSLPLRASSFIYGIISSTFYTLLSLMNAEGLVARNEPSVKFCGGDLRLGEPKFEF